MSKDTPKSKPMNISAFNVMTGIYSVLALSIGAFLGLVQLNELVENKLFFFRNVIEVQIDAISKSFPLILSPILEREPDVVIEEKNSELQIIKGDFSLAEFREFKLSSDHMFIFGKFSGIQYLINKNQTNQIVLWKIPLDVFSDLGNDDFKEIFYNENKKVFHSDLKQLNDFVLNKSINLEKLKNNEMNMKMKFVNFWQEPSINFSGKIRNSNLFYWRAIPKSVFYQGIYSSFKKYTILLFFATISSIMTAKITIIYFKKSKRFELV